VNRHERRRGRLRLWIGGGVIVVVSGLVAAQSAPGASPLTARPTETRASPTGAGSQATSVADQETADTGGPCPPNPTYPITPTDQTQYEVPFTADVLDGTVNVGYNEDTGGPGTKPLTKMPWFPWMLHVTGLGGTVSGCVPLPGLSLSVQPSNLHLNTYGYMQGPDNCSSSQQGCNLAPNSSATFSFTGIADPGQTNLPLFLAGDNENAAGTTTLHYQTTPTPGPGLEVGIPTFNEEYPYPKKGQVTNVDLSAGSPPGSELDPNVYAGYVTVTNTSASTVTSITGEESAGFISGPSTLLPYGSKGDSGTYTFTFDASSYGYLPDEQAIPLTFTGEGSSGLVDGYGTAYFNFPSLDVAPLAITAATIDGEPAMTAPGPQLPMGSVFNGTVTLTNNTSSTVTGIFGETAQAVQLLATVGTSGSQEPPLVLGGFTLAVSASNPLAATVVGARPDALGDAPFGALDAMAAASATGALSASDPSLACGAPVSTTGTTGSSTVVPASPAGDPPHPGGSQWTVQGEPIAGPLVGATARLVSNNFSLQIPANSPPGYSQPCGDFGELFNWGIGGVQPNGDFYNCPQCASYGDSGPVDAGAGPGEVQVEIDVLVTSVGALPVCRPTTTTPVTCGN